MLRICLLFLPLAICNLGSASEDLPRRAVLGLPYKPITTEQSKALELPAGVGVIAEEPIAGLTAAIAQIKKGDILVEIDGQSVSFQTLAAQVAKLSANQQTKLTVMRDGKRIDLQATVTEKPRDPGNEHYEVLYRQITSGGKDMRTIITRPRMKGVYPAFLFIQGLAPVSYDYVLESATGDVATLDGPLLREFANSNFVTLRVEKPGVGDSEGGPFEEWDFQSELDVYRQALVQLKSMEDVDQENIFIFGHSMGGSFGPMLAKDYPIKGIAVYGTIGRTLMEYLTDVLRYQAIVAGDPYDQVDAKVRAGSELLTMVLLQNTSIDDAVALKPEFAALARGLFPQGKFNGKTLEFWRQLAQLNIAEYWIGCKSNVLAARGASDFITYDADHKLIADMVNANHPGHARWESVADSDHLFHKFESESQSLHNFQNGDFNPAFALLMKDWMLKQVN